ncbi:hypothetical protein [Candidatus Symbiobacter mobilis]|uniref:Methyltransferase type 11 n=1 Tax=Candidatus Symbiobacter mobilis CR TaxID=946483 RepID=U5N9Z3_9BURK|nr:hypothetical protein [Candidatus Symbiobacter mobilis]AGX88140.1 methyltransferase type 11 [Candidatus Symbiobacter mobilis CR]
MSLFHVFGYQITNDAVQAFFDSAVRHLNSGGLFLFDFWYSPSVYSHRPEVRVKRMTDECADIIRIAESVLHPNENRVDVHYTIQVCNRNSQQFKTWTEVHRMRHFSIPEVDLWAERAGFHRINVEEIVTKCPPSEKTWAVFVVLQKL